MLARIGVVPLLVLSMASCDFASFDSYRAQAPVVTFVPPASYTSLRYGLRIAATSSGTTRDWLVVSGGLGTPIVAQPIRDGSRIAPSEPAPRQVCGGNAMCSPMMRAGDPMVGMVSWSGEQACVALGSFGAIHQVSVVCWGSGSTRIFDLPAPTGFEQSGFGIALAAPRVARGSSGAALEILIVGAPAGQGHVFAVDPVRTQDVTPAGVVSSGLGSAVALGRSAPVGGAVTSLLVAASVSTGRVVVMRGNLAAGAGPLDVLGCASSRESGFGGVLAAGDIDGDGVDEVFVGSLSDAGAVGRTDRVHVYSVARAPGTATCDTMTWPESFSITCADTTSPGVSCDGPNGGFGSALATGDLDGDGIDELVVGAPKATVAGVTSAGAVYVFRRDTAVPGLSLRMAAVVRDAAPRLGGELGSSILCPDVGARDEILASVPGVREVRMFLCSGLDGDRPDAPGLGPSCR